MKQTLFIGILAGVLAAGCSKEEELTIAPPSNGGGVSATDPVSGPGGGAAAEGSIADPSKIGPPPPAVPMDFTAPGADRPRDGAGNPVTDLAYLNQILADYNNLRASFHPEGTPYKTDEERQAYEAALAKAKEALRKPITDLNQLVKDGIIKSIPAAPAGQRYAINPQTHKVELVAQ